MHEKVETLETLETVENFVVPTILDDYARSVSSVSTVSCKNPHAVWSVLSVSF